MQGGGLPPSRAVGILLAARVGGVPFWVDLVALRLVAIPSLTHGRFFDFFEPVVSSACILCFRRRFASSCFLVFLNMKMKDDEKHTDFYEV